MKQVLIHSRQVYTFNSLHNQFPEFLLERLILDEEVKLQPLQVFGGSWEL